MKIFKASYRMRGLLSNQSKTPANLSYFQGNFTAEHSAVMGVTFCIYKSAGIEKVLPAAALHTLVIV
jgi:hypothetical protein